MNTIQTFEAFKLAPFLTDKLLKQGIKTPTNIQQQSIPVAMRGKDILGSAETGSGKTLAFAAPIIHKLYDNPEGKAVIIAPTRELAEQIAKNIRGLLPQKITMATLIGGAPMFKQLQQLRQSPRIIVGTPGRMIDHLERGKLDVSDTSILVLDETDRMLDMGFSEQIDVLVDETPKDRQTLLFSATMPRNILRVANRYLTDPVRVKIGDVTKPSDSITQKFINVDNKSKLNTLIKEANERDGSMIVFVKTKMGADNLCTQLQRQDFSADTIHGDLRHGKRQRVIRAFHQKKYRILVATDVAARGLDIPHIEHVINYDLPQCPEDYVHRIGRTGRAGRTGHSLCMVAPGDQFKLRAIKRYIGGDDDTSSSHNTKRSYKKNGGRGGYASGNKSKGRYGSKNQENGGRGGEFKRTSSGSKGRYGSKNQEDGGRGGEFKRTSSGSKGRYSSKNQEDGGRSGEFKRTSSGDKGRYGAKNPENSGRGGDFQRGSGGQKRFNKQNNGNKTWFDNAPNDNPNKPKRQKKTVVKRKSDK